MPQYGVLVVDDSALMRRAISKWVESDPQCFVVGLARNGIEAVEKAQRLKPDVITMDVEMPGMDGLTALQQIMQLCPVPVVMLSSYTDSGTIATLEALERGAVDFFLKESLFESASTKYDQDYLVRLKAAAKAKVQGYLEPAKTVSAPDTSMKRAEPSKIDFIIIGCSTGGPSALQSILPRFTSDFLVPILVVQHMPPGFTKPLADRFNQMCKLQVREAEDGDTIQTGTILVAPAGFQTVLQRRGNGEIKVQIKSQTPLETLYKPSIDVTVASASTVYADKLLAVILTGMGADGLHGCKRVKECGGHVISESEETCIVYGMPKVVHEAGYSDRQSPLPEIYEQILSFI